MNIDRRKLLGTLAAALTVEPTLAMGIPTEAVGANQKEETAMNIVAHQDQFKVVPTLAPVARVNRLAFELARAMDDWMIDLGHEGRPDLWQAQVLPAGFTTWPVAFRHIGRENGIQDPLETAILAYREGDRKFNEYVAIDDEDRDAYIDLSYGPPMEVIRNWEEPATTERSAIAAVKLALHHTEEMWGDDIVASMLRAALGYFDPTDAIALANEGGELSLPSPAGTAIDRLYGEWLLVRDSARSENTDFNRLMERYRVLQESIIKAEPVTPTDVAIQFYVDADSGESDNSEEFRDKLISRALAGTPKGVLSS